MAMNAMKFQLSVRTVEAFRVNLQVIVEYRPKASWTCLGIWSMKPGGLCVKNHVKKCRCALSTRNLRTTSRYASCLYTSITLCCILSQICIVLVPSPLSLLSFLGLSIIFTLYTLHLGLLCRYAVVNDQRRQLPTLDTTCVQAFAIFLDLEPAAGVVTVDDSGTLVRRDEGLVFVP